MKMILIILYIIFLTSLVFAGQVVCYDINGEITSYQSSGNPKDGCLYYDPPQNVSQIEYDRVQNLFKTQPYRYIKILAGSPIEKAPAEKVAIDDALALEIKNTEIARIDTFNITGGEIGNALSALIQQSLTILDIKSNLTLQKIKDKIKEQKGLL